MGKLFWPRLGYFSSCTGTESGRGSCAGTESVRGSCTGTESGRGSCTGTESGRGSCTGTESGRGSCTGTDRECVGVGRDPAVGQSVPLYIPLTTEY